MARAPALPQPPLPPAAATEGPPLALPDADPSWPAVSQQYPFVFAAPTLPRVPRGLDRRYARLRTLTLQWMLDACRSGAPLDSQLHYARLSWVTPWLLLYDPRAVSDNHDTLTDARSVRQTVLDRIAMMETGHWSQLLAQSLPHATRDRPAAAAPPQPLAVLDHATISKACEKALDGSLKAAVRILHATQPLPPTEATVKEVLSLYPVDEDPVSTSRAALPHSRPVC